MTDLRAEWFEGEQWIFEPRTTDPATTQEGERWLRTDLNSGDKIATLRVDVGDTIHDVPIFATGTAVDTVSEAMRIQVNGSTGYVPIAPVSDAAFPELRMQHNSEIYGHHDRVEPGSAIPDSVVHYYDPREESGVSTLQDREGNNDLSANGDPVLTTGSNSINGNLSVYYDGTDDEHLGSPVSTGQNGEYAFATVIDTDLSTNYNGMVTNGVFNDTGFAFVSSSNSGNVAVFHDTSDARSGSGYDFSGGSVIVVSYDGTSVTVEVDNTEAISESLSAPTDPTTKYRIAATGDGSNRDMAIGELYHWDRSLSASERTEIHDVLNSNWL